MQVKFYNCKDDPKKLKKTLTNETSFSVVLQANTTLLNPSILLNGAQFRDFVNLNYAYIPTFKRYYFVGDPTFLPGDMIEIPLSVDVLFSNKSTISSLSTLIERQEYKVNRYMTDSLLPTVVSRKILRRNIGNLGEPSGANIALTVSGGEG